MGHQFEGHQEARVDATAEEVWEAIATGPGIDSWFMGRNEVEGGQGGAVRTAFGGYAPEHRITEWRPGERFAYRSDDAPDGRFIAYEFMIAGRDRGSTVVRIVTSGFLPGDDWEDEYDAMLKGGELFFHTLVEYLSHFAGRHATPVTAFGPPVADWDHAWATLRRAFGLAEPVDVGSAARFAGVPTSAGRTGDDDGDGDGEPETTLVDGVVYFTNAHTLGIRTDDALYRFMKGFHGPMIASHHIFAGTDREPAERAWTDWLARALTTR
ncbi:SRPBCC family protein [Phytoactinopolyspora halotolerans]|uniref:SRPBCC domain-containing protein n=1 Tax=Phytoactinopolyspora halotolerans TaxID=1981512 RepID=A0A6L9SK20_9ACTN|nr:SRPBCC domain-containing protein [Phytoactinopolyspora halotolerans]NEE04430.1 SRPBCC domain-containing protein [Phytoactinopolyspora halotolerans]